MNLHIKPRLSLWLTLIGLAVSWLLVIVITLRYAGDESLSGRHWTIAGMATLLLAASGALVVFLTGRRSREGATADRLGIDLGLVAGVLWVLEISFNNFVDPRISTGQARFYLDNSTWALVTLLILAAGFSRSWQTRRFLPAIRAGVWSGLISGLFACLMALMLVVFWMRFLLRDPLNIQEYAARDAGAHSPGMAAYFAWETVSGALGHLIVLGIVWGLLFGSIGGGLAKVIRLSRSKR